MHSGPCKFLVTLHNIKFKYHILIVHFTFKVKSELNEKNSYNHNFNGSYCTCNKPYPDPEDTNPDDMVQCIICEDWLHGKVFSNVLMRNNFKD